MHQHHYSISIEEHIFNCYL